MQDVYEMFTAESLAEEHAELIGRVRALYDWLITQEYNTVDKKEVAAILGIELPQVK